MNDSADRSEVLVVRGLHKHFALKKRDARGGRAMLRAVDGVDFVLHAGETLGLVGESGCGKSTLSRSILKVHRPTAGEVLLDVGERGAPQLVDLARARGRKLRRARRHIQMIFQDPFASLDPRMTVEAIVAEPLEVHRVGSRAEIRRRTQALLEEVGLEPKIVKRFPHEFSGGQRQRIGIARALALNPKTIICDEPVSALDVSIRGQVLNLFLDLQMRRGLSYLFIAHDLSVVKRISHRVAVMYLGRIVESAPSEEIYSAARHPYTRALLSAIPIPEPDVERRRRRIRLRGEVPSGIEPRGGCPFAPRCPEVFDACHEVTPRLGPEGAPHVAACLLDEASWPPGSSPRIPPDAGSRGD